MAKVSTMEVYFGITFILTI